MDISTHSAREDGDNRRYLDTGREKRFQPTPPARTETCGRTASGTPVCDFNPLRPRGRRPLLLSHPHRRRNFNPLRPRGRRHNQQSLKHRNTDISTHSAREDGDNLAFDMGMRCRRFQPTPPARTETLGCVFDLSRLAISTHSAREDGDLIPRSLRNTVRLFQPTPPARTETLGSDSLSRFALFQPTPPARTETHPAGPPPAPHEYFNPLRPRGRRL